MRYCFNILVSFAITLLSVGCNSVAITPVPTQKPIEINLSDGSKTVELKEVVSDVALGTVIGHFDWNYWGKPILFNPSEKNIFIDSLKKHFYKELGNAGYKTIDAPESLLGEHENKRASFVIGAKIIDIKQNRYSTIDLLFERIKVAQYVKVNWQVYARKPQSVVGTFDTEGYHEGLVEFGDMQTAIAFDVIDGAASNSVQNLLALQTFVDIFTGTTQ